MVTSNSSISPELEQGPRPRHPYALIQCEGDACIECLRQERQLRKELEKEAWQRKNATAYLIDENARLKRKIALLEDSLSMAVIRQGQAEEKLLQNN